MVKIDFTLLFLTICLSLLSLINFFSVSYYLSLKLFNNPFYYFWQFFVKITLLGFLFYFIGFNIAKKFISYKKIFILITFFLYFLIILAFLPPFRLENATAARWLDLKFVTLQPSELIKPFAIIFLIFLFSLNNKFSIYQKIILFFLTIIILITPIFLQPSFSNVLIIFSTLFIVFLVYLKNFKEFFISLLFALIFILILILLASFWGYRKERLLSFLSGGTFHQEKYFQLEQSLIAVSSGGLFGKGLGNSEIKIIGLPQMLTDNIFSIFAEENGFIGVVFILLLFYFLILKIILIGIQSNNWRKPFAFGVSLWLLLQTFLHIASNIGLFVPTGVILPFFSYGASGQIAIYFSLGLLSRK